MVSPTQVVTQEMPKLMLWMVLSSADAARLRVVPESATPAQGGGLDGGVPQFGQLVVELRDRY